MVIDGMHGMGDNVHQRALVRHLLAQHQKEVLWLKTPWPCLYHDLVGERLRIVPPGRTLRTQAKNAKRETDRYTGSPPPLATRPLRVWYDRDAVNRAGSVVGGMLYRTLGYSIVPDFRLPVPQAWRDKADAVLDDPLRPVMLFRPLVDRTEWRGCTARNPDLAAYSALYMAIRPLFHVISIADLVPNVEWLVGSQLPADQTFHAGELDVETIAGLMTRAALTFCSPGFAVALSQAVGTPVVAVFGGYESSLSFSAGASFTPTLGIDPIKPCRCWAHNHACDKRIDLDAALTRLFEFIHPQQRRASCLSAVSSSA